MKWEMEKYVIFILEEILYLDRSFSSQKIKKKYNLCFHLEWFGNIFGHQFIATQRSSEEGE